MNGNVTWRIFLTIEEARPSLPEIADSTIFPIVVLIFDESQAFVMDRSFALNIYQSYISQLILFHDVNTKQNTILPPQEITE